VNALLGRRWLRRVTRVTTWTITVVNALLLIVLLLVFAVAMPNTGVVDGRRVSRRLARPCLSSDASGVAGQLDRVDLKVAEACRAEDKRFWSHDGTTCWRRPRGGANGRAAVAYRVA
jgi:hypothetical protein